MSVLRRLLSIAAVATSTRETTPEEAADLAAKEQLSLLNPPEVEPTPLQGEDEARDKKQR